MSEPISRAGVSGVVDTIWPIEYSKPGSLVIIKICKLPTSWPEYGKDFPQMLQERCKKKTKNKNKTKTESKQPCGLYMKTISTGQIFLY